MPKSTNPLLRRKISSPFDTLQRKEPGSRKPSLTKKGDFERRLDDTGLIPQLTPLGVSEDVLSLIWHILSHMFAKIPERAPGMNSERISEVLRYRAALPPTVSVAHLQALSRSATATERESAQLVALGVVRRISIPGRGKGGAIVGDCIALTEEWKRLLTGHAAIGDETKQVYAKLMDEQATSASAPSPSFTQEQVSELVHAGFLTSPSALSGSLSDLFAAPGTSSLGNVAIAGTKAATGTLAAVGGYGAIQESGAGGSALAPSRDRVHRAVPRCAYNFSLPNTGQYLKLLVEAREHLLALLKKTSPRYKEATRDLLREKWEGNVGDDSASRAKRLRGEWNGVLPGKTQKWKRFYGLEFDWVLAECVGSGLVELFDTGSVGLGVRAS